MLASLLSLPSQDLELPESRAYDIMVKTQALETDSWVPVLTLLHTSCATSATYWTFLGTVPPSPSSLEANNTCITFSIQN